MMEYNECKTCKAGDGRCGMMINNECMNCYDTRRTGDISIHTGLKRNGDEINRTINIIHPETIARQKFLEDLANVLEHHNVAICSEGDNSSVSFQFMDYDFSMLDTKRLHSTGYELRCINDEQKKALN